MNKCLFCDDVAEWQSGFTNGKDLCQYHWEHQVDRKGMMEVIAALRAENSALHGRLIEAFRLLQSLTEASQ